MHRNYDRARERGVRIDELAPGGFGAKVIERSLPHMLGGTAELIFNPDGVHADSSLHYRYEESDDS
jgi:hypothetical protein